jgi:hypothetical protein
MKSDRKTAGIVSVNTPLVYDRLQSELWWDHVLLTLDARATKGEGSSHCQSAIGDSMRGYKSSPYTPSVRSAITSQLNP